MRAELEPPGRVILLSVSCGHRKHKGQGTQVKGTYELYWRASPAAHLLCKELHLS